MSSDVPVHVEVLGPLRVVDGERRDRSPRGALQQRLLALLVLHRGRVVSADAVVDALWPTGRPDDPVAALHNHVSRLRASLPGCRIDSVGDGYRLDPATVDVDADVLADLVSRDPVADPAVLDALESLLARWAGPAYAELEEVPDARIEAQRLEELRVRAREVRAEALLARGTTDGLVADLNALCAAEPLRERPRALLMQALTAAGRQAEALRVYDDFRRLLADELGTEPSPVLTVQHLDLLAGATGPGWHLTTSLPVPATSLVGRDRAADDLAALVDATRLVSLVGPGGVGKTRLLVELGQRLRDARTDRPVVLCELATADGDSLVDVVAGALGIDARPGVPVADHLLRTLAASELVLLLDNCEHVLAPAAELVERLLARCPHVQVATSSRERLRVGGEHVWPVPPLPVQDGATTAVDLFVERARAVRSGFDPDPAARVRIGEIVRRLDGLPLAIELAAARLLTHELDEIAGGLDRRFSLLADGYRTSDRHGSLRAAVSWSYDLLDDDLQHAFSDVSVFSGSFSAADAAAVSGSSVDDVSIALSRLVERSLVTRSGGRYLLLETLRAFGRDRLATRGRSDQVAARHAEHYVTWARAADERLYRTADHPVALEVEEVLPELRSALGWLVEQGRFEPAAELVCRLLDYGIMRLRPDVLAWAERLVAAGLPDDCAHASRAWVNAAYAAWTRGDLAAMEARCARALAISRRQGSTPAEVLTVHGTLALAHGRLEDSAAWYRKAVAAAEGTDEPQRLMASSSLLLPLGYAGDATAAAHAAALLDEVGDQVTPYAAYVWHCAGEADLDHDLDRARARLTRAVEIGEATHAAFVTGLAGATLASLEFRSGDPVAAAAAYRGLLLQWRRAGMWSTQWTMLRSVAGLLARLGRHREAAVLEGAVRSTRAGHRIYGQDEENLRALGLVLRDALGEIDYEDARRHGAELDGDAAVEFALRAL